MIRVLLKTTWFHLAIIAFVIPVVIACNKTDTPGVEDINPTPPILIDTVVKGTVYHVTDQSLMKVEMESGNIVWQKGLNDAAGTGLNLYYDSGYIYHRGRIGISCYNSINGNTVWRFGWLAYSDANYSNTIAFNDSLVFFSSQTSAWAPSSLYCMRKRTGVLLWKKQIDQAGWASNHFFAIQAVANGKVVTISRNSNGQRKLICLNVADGQQLWETPVNDLLKPTIKIFNDKVYCNGPTAFCYDLNTGSLLWQNNFGLPSASPYFSCSSTLDQNKLYTIVPSATSSIQHAIKTINFTTGAIESSFNTLSGPYVNSNSYQFSNHMVYAISPHSQFDSTELQAYDITTATLKWKYHNFSSYRQPIISTKHIIYREYLGPNTDSNPLYLTVLNLDGKRIRRIKVPGKYIYGILYIDENNTQFNQTLY
jgi:outer membrane protein assembly factor BamB